METFNLSGKKLSKNSIQIHLVGTLDELNAHLGLIKVKVQNEKDKSFLEAVQLNLVTIMSLVSDSANEKYFLPSAELEKLKEEIKTLKAGTGDFQFALPGKNETDALVHIARTVARRAERYYTAVYEQTPLCKNAASFLNKLSEYLFYLSRIC